jgi:hypothetical protein
MASETGCWHNERTWFAGWKIGYRRVDRSAWNGLEGHGNASWCWTSNLSSGTVKLTGGQAQDKLTSRTPERQIRRQPMPSVRVAADET